MSGEEPGDYIDPEVGSPEPVRLVDDRGRPEPQFTFETVECIDNKSIKEEQQSTMSLSAPKIGGRVTDEIMWIGGAPLFEWKGTCLLAPNTPLCYRSADPVQETKNFLRRVDPPDTKFKRDDPDYPLRAFAADALEHMQTNGMDTIFYMETAKDGITAEDDEGAKEIFTYHSRYTKEEVKAKMDELVKTTFDPYLKTAMKESGKWLAGALDISLKTSLRGELSKHPSGPVLWMLIVGEVQSNSLQRSVELTEEFEKLELSMFKGENVRDYCTKAEELLNQLEKEDQLPKTHLLKIIDVLTKCSVMDFKIQWMTRRTAVEEFLRQSHGKDQAAILKLSNYQSYTILLDTAKTDYDNLAKQWGPATNVQAKTAEATLTNKLQGMIAKTIDAKLKGVTDAPSNGNNTKICDYCGKKNHIRPECRSLQQDKKNNCVKPNKINRKKGGKAGESNGNDVWAAPKSGEPHTKVIQGKERKYCSKCRGGKGAWTLNHLTEDHKSKEELDGARAGASGNVADLDLNPEARNTLNAWLGLT